MQAITVIPGKANSARLKEVPEPPARDGEVLIAAAALGVCGTDLEILRGDYGSAPKGEERLILGHESVGEVLEAPPESGFCPGDWVAGVVRRPDPAPCPSCAVGEWDMCQNGGYLERGIKGLHGFGSTRYRLEAGFAVKVDPTLGLLGVLVEPTSVVAKAWDHLEHIGSRARWTPRRVLVTGAGPIGLLAALLGVQRGLAVDVLDRATDGPKPALVRDLGASYHTGRVEDLCRVADVVIECTGAPRVIFAALGATRPNGIICLAGMSSRGHQVPVDLGALNRNLVLDNSVVFGSVNANLAHYRAAGEALARADRAWVGRLISRRVPLVRWWEALERGPQDVKPVIVFDGR
jgi:threonine dehydrogenase-like Zn-dependent dehydrogenase